MDPNAINFKDFYKEFKELMSKYGIPYYIFKTPTMTMTCGMNDTTNLKEE